MQTISAIHDPAGLRVLGQRLLQEGRLPEAIACLQRAVDLAPDSMAGWQLLAACYAQVSIDRADARVGRDLRHLLSLDAIDPRHLRRIVLRFMRLQPGFADILALGGQDAELDPPLLARALAALCDPMLLALMRKDRLCDPDLERLLARTRRTLLAGAVANPAETRRFVLGLAHHCFLNEYIHPEGEAERREVRALERRIAAALAAGPPEPADVALLACYRPLHTLPMAPALLGLLRRDIEPGLREILVRQVEEPHIERTLQDEIPALTPVADAVSQAVRAHYEAAPYPRWRQAGGIEAQPTADVVQAQLPHLANRAIAWPAAPRILVAGCGTGRQAIEMAQRFAGAAVLGVDLSRVSLAYALRMTRLLGLDNVRYAQADLLALGEDEAPFDIVAASGVLHHLRDPMEGWRRLLGRLAPGGLMQIGLYSEAARASVAAARAFIAARGHATTPDGIRRCRAEIMALPDSHPARGVVGMFDDFFTLSGCRDLLFHVQEHRFTLPQIAAALNSLGLEFLGFRLPPAVRQRYRARFPQDRDATSLALWHDYERENPFTFAGMYQFWALKR